MSARSLYPRETAWPLRGLPYRTDQGNGCREKNMPHVRRRYTRISEAEMRGFLSNRGFQEMELEGTRELVMGRRVGEFISLRVYTSISRGSARDRGKDAIRVELYWMDRANGNEIIHIGHSRKVLRIQTWRRNLAKRINNWQSLIGPDCPSCGAKMRLVSGRYGDFWGCGRYHTTGCGHTIDES